MTATPFVNKVGTFGDHPTLNANRHLQTQRHKDVVSNKLAFDNLSKRRADVWKLLQEAANRFVIGSFFQITWLLVKKNWAHSHNFKSIVELVAACSGEEIKKHLLYAPQNANFVSPEYTFSNVFKSWMITSNYLFLHHFVLLTHFCFLLMELQTSQWPSKWPFRLLSTTKGLLENIMWEPFL